MKPEPLPALTIGLDVISGETALPKGAVRRALNITIQNNGDWQRRPGHELLTELEGAHSLWQSPAQTRVLIASEDTLYDVDLATGAVAPLFVGLSYEQPVEYCDVGPDIYFTCAGLLRKITPAGLVRRPGVADTLGNLPTLTAAAGALPAGRYGVAYSLVNDLGEESPVSSIAWIDLTTGAIAVSGIQTAPDVVSVRLYATTCNGKDLYLNETFPVAATASVTHQDTKRLATRQFCHPMPGGNIVRLFNGRLYVVAGKWVWVSQPQDYGVSDTRSGWITFGRTINVFEPVDAGIFVVFRERTAFLRGNGPGGFSQVDVSEHGAWAYTGASVPADYFNPDVAPDRAQAVACWCSEVGIAVGRPDGSLVYPQAGRLRMAAGQGRPLFMQQNGIKQGVFCLETLNMGVGGAIDVTI